jgi:hypothetical protein
VADAGRHEEDLPWLLIGERGGEVAAACVGVDDEAVGVEVEGVGVVRERPVDEVEDDGSLQKKAVVVDWCVKGVEA